MTIEELLECSGEELEKLSDLEIEEFFHPYLQFVRPSPENSQKNSSETLNHFSKNTNANVGGTTSKRAKNKDLDKQLLLLEELARKKGLIA